MVGVDISKRDKNQTILFMIIKHMSPVHIKDEGNYYNLYHLYMIHQDLEMKRFELIIFKFSQQNCVEMGSLDID